MLFKTDRDDVESRSLIHQLFWAIASVIRGYFDESGKENDPQLADSACVVAGYVASDETWPQVERSWQEVLKSPQYDVPYLHMREFAHSSKGSPFESWKSEPSKRASFLADLAEVVAESSLFGVCGLIRLPDLKRFNSETGLALEAYSLGMFACLLELSINFPNVSIETIWDRVERHEQLISLARSYAASERFYPKFGQRIEIAPLAKHLSSKVVPALQIADFAAYELLKSHRGKNDWFLHEMPNTEPDNWNNSYAKWSFDRMIDSVDAGRKNVRTYWPDERRSHLALFNAKNSRPMEGGVWTYHTLCAAHTSRNGIWQ